MINSDMKTYNFYTFGAPNAYGQPQLSKEVQGSITIAIYTTSQSTQDNINYKGANYIGLTQAEVKDTYVIEYENEKLKVLYVNPKGRYKQVFLVKI